MSSRIFTDLIVCLDPQMRFCSADLKGLFALLDERFASPFLRRRLLLTGGAHRWIELGSFDEASAHIGMMPAGSKGEHLRLADTIASVRDAVGSECVALSLCLIDKMPIDVVLSDRMLQVTQARVTWAFVWTGDERVANSEGHQPDYFGGFASVQHGHSSFSRRIPNVAFGSFSDLNMTGTSLHAALLGARTA